MGLEAVERDLIVSALRLHNWNQSQAARHLNISRKTLMYRMAKHKIEKDTPPAGPSAKPQGMA